MVTEVRSRGRTDDKEMLAMRHYPAHDAQLAPRDAPRSRAAGPIRDPEKPRPNAELELLRRRYVQELNRLYGGELEHLNVLPEMAAVAQALALKDAFQYHFEKTQAHVERLDQIFAGLGMRPVNLKHRAAPEARPRPSTSDTLAGYDAVLIAAARKLEHYEISGYLLALNCAQILLDRAAAKLLEQTLKEEYEADQILAALGAYGAGSSGDKVEHGGAPDPVRAGSAEPS